MSNGMTHIQLQCREFARAFNKLWLFESWILDRRSSSSRYIVRWKAVVRWPSAVRCICCHWTMYQKKKKRNFQPIRICLPHAQIRGMTVGHSIALLNVHLRTSEAGNLFVCEQKHKVWVFIFLVTTKGILWYHNYWVLRKCFVLRSCHLLRISVGGVMQDANVTYLWCYKHY